MVAVVQLVRASDCGSECRGFESHLPPQQNAYSINKTQGSVAQLNRASDYGSEGCRFESCRSHKFKESFTLRKALFFCIYAKSVIQLCKKYKIRGKPTAF